VKGGKTMTIGLALVDQLIKRKLPFSYLSECGINPDFFRGDERKVYDFITEHIQRYDQLPKIETIEQETEVEIPDFPDEPLQYWIECVRNREKSDLVLDGYQKVVNLIAAGKTTPAIKKIQSLADELKKKEPTKFNGSVGITALDLISRDYPKPKWAVPAILPEGLNILAGKPKHGKSIFALSICMAIAGLKHKALGKINVEKGAALCLALEDPERRLQQRIVKMSGQHRGQDLERLHLFTNFPRMGDGGLKKLGEEIEKISNLRLVVIDTLAKFRPANNVRNKSAYDIDYQSISEIKTLADKYSISILIIHHLRKSDAEDVMDTFSGTLGLTGAADGLLALVRRTGEADAELHVTGRDIEANAYALKFMPRALRWELMGGANEVKNTKMQQELFNALKEAATPLSPKELSELTGFSAGYVKKTLAKFIKNEEGIKKIGRGKYEYTRKN
jgi:hypothetical protein